MRVELPNWTQTRLIKEACVYFNLHKAPADPPADPKTTDWIIKMADDPGKSTFLAYISRITWKTIEMECLDYGPQNYYDIPYESSLKWIFLCSNYVAITGEIPGSPTIRTR